MAQHEVRLPLAAEEQRLEEQRQVRSGELERTPRGSVQRAFLGYVSALENEEWPVALAYYPRLTQHRLGPEMLVQALRREGANALVRPLVRAIRTARGGQTIIRYYLRRADGTLRPTSMAWRKRDGRWYIDYSPTLDDSYSSAVQQAVQDRLDPTATTPSKAALSAGRRAARAQAAILSRP